MAQLLLLPPSVVLSPSVSGCSPSNLPNLIARGLVNTWEPFSKGVAPAKAHPKVRERRRGPAWACGALLLPASLVLLLAERKAKNLGVHLTSCLCGARERVSPGCLKCKFIIPRGAVSKAGRSQVIVGQLGEQRIFQNSSIVFPLQWVPAPYFPQRTPGKWHFPKSAARSETCGWLMLWLFRRDLSSNAGKEPPITLLGLDHDF